MRFSSLFSFKRGIKADAQVHIKADAQVHKSNSLRRLSLVDETSPDPCVNPSLAAKSSVGQAGYLRGSVSGSASSNNSAASQVVEQASISARNPFRRRSLPIMHLQEDHSSIVGSCAIMDNPPVFDNPLRRRGCCNHKFTEQMSGYRQEAIQRELRVKRHYTDDMAL